MQDVYWLIDWSPEDWLHHVNERTPLSSRLPLLAPFFFLAEGCHFLSPTQYSQFTLSLPIKPSYRLHKEKPYLKMKCGWGNGLSSQYTLEPGCRHHSSHISSFCCQSICLCVSSVPVQAQAGHTRTFCLVLCCFNFVTRTWSDLVLLSKLTGALGIKWTHCHKKSIRRRTWRWRWSAVACCKHRAGPSFF